MPAATSAAGSRMKLWLRIVPVALVLAGASGCGSSGAAGAGGDGGETTSGETSTTASSPTTSSPSQERKVFGAKQKVVEEGAGKDLLLKQIFEQSFVPDTPIGNGGAIGGVS